MPVTIEAASRSMKNDLTHCTEAERQDLSFH
ncbi:hypothetical protein ACVWXL_000538 [Bradyrhizobium sp. GM22.5]